MRCLLMLLCLQVLACFAAAQSTGLVPLAEPETEIARPAEEIQANSREANGQKDPMSELLHWAIEHSDPEKLKTLMEQYKEKNLTIKDIYGQEVVDAFFKSEGDVMSEQIAVIQDFRNASLPDSMLEAALEELEELLHQVDHAGNLKRMGGMQPLLDLGLGAEREEGIRSLALWALGVAVQNNAPVQEELHSLGGLTSLAERLRECGDVSSTASAWCAKLLFCLSGLLKNAPALQAEADQLGVTRWMMEVGLKHPAAAVVKKALGLLDIVFAQSPELPFLDGLAETREETAKSLLTLVESADVDTSEKAIALLGRLAELRPLFSSFREELIGAARRAQHHCEEGGGDKDVCSGLLHAAAEVDRKLAGRWGLDEL